MKSKIGITVSIIIAILVFVIFLVIKNICSPILIIDSFEGQLIGGPAATVDYGSGSGAKVDIYPSKNPVIHGKQSLKIVYDASQGGYMWIARGYNLTIPTAAQWKTPPSKIKWDNYDAFCFFIYGNATNNEIAIDLIDNGKEYCRYTIKDDTQGWKEIIIPFNEFKTRTDWQPDSATRNNIMDFPINAFQFEPKEATGEVFIDKVYLRKKSKQEKNEIK